MFSTTVLDKDGVSAACHLATMCCYLQKSYSLTLAQKLNEIYTKYGHHITCNSYYLCYEPQVITRIFNRLRHFNQGVIWIFVFDIKYILIIFCYDKQISNI